MGGQAKLFLLNTSELGGDYPWTCPYCDWTVRVRTPQQRRAERDAHRCHSHRAVYR